MNKLITNQAHKLINESQFIIITSHKSPDGDSVGSSTALFSYLNKLNKEVVICFPDKPPFFLNWMNGAKQILTYEDHKDEVIFKFKKTDLIFCLDYNAASRLGNGLKNLLLSCKAKKIMIDHHENPEKNLCDLMISRPKISSTAELIFDFINIAGNIKYIDKYIGESIYCGIMSDTGSFRFPSTNSKTHKVIAHLIDLGVNNSKVHDKVFDNNTIDKIKLRTHIINNSLQLLQHQKIAIISVSQKELNDYNYTKGYTEGLVNEILSIKGVLVATFFKEQDGIIKISFRSKGKVYVNEFASSYFEGGGHQYASGGKFKGELNNAIKKFVTLSEKLV